MSRIVIGLTGGIACGKSNITSALRKAGAPVVDADEISRALTAPGGKALPKIRSAFGDNVFDGDNLNRAALASLVFANEQKREQLNNILHPLIFQTMREQMDAVAGNIVLDVPLLYECGLDALCDEVWCVYAPLFTQLRRLRARGMSLRQAWHRIRSQLSPKEKARRADRVIRTTGTPEESTAQALQWWRAYESQ